MLAAVALPVVESPLSHDRPGPDKADAGDDSLQDVCLAHSARAEDGYCGLDETAAGHRDQRESANAGAPLFARPIPADRQGQQKSDEQMDEVLAAVVPPAE
jgi:hypothetical protein